jgi:hypothetical protein
MNGPVEPDHPDVTVGGRPGRAGRTRRNPTTTTLEDRSSSERDEWRAAGCVATGLERAVVALGLAAARSNHAAAEGADQ